MYFQLSRVIHTQTQTTTASTYCSFDLKQFNPYTLRETCSKSVLNLETREFLIWRRMKLHHWQWLDFSCLELVLSDVLYLTVLLTEIKQGKSKYPLRSRRVLWLCPWNFQSFIHPEWNRSTICLLLALWFLAVERETCSSSPIKADQDQSNVLHELYFVPYFPLNLLLEICLPRLFVA